MNRTEEKIEFVPVETPEQIAQLCGLAREIWRQHFTPIIGAEQVEYMLKKFQSPKAIADQLENGYRYWLFFLGEEVIGYTGVHPEPDKLFLSKLYLRQDQRGNGFASQAMRFLSDFAQKNGEHSIWLTVNRHNDRTIEVYRHLGFQKLREEKNDIGGGFFMDDLILAKQLG